MTIKKFVDKYYVERKNTDSLKWDALKERYGDGDLLPLWVADTEFSTPRTVVDALQKRVEQGIFGYSQVPADYFSAYQGWQKRHEDSPFQAEWLYFSTGVVQSLYDLIDCFTEARDHVLIQPPVYYPFYNAIVDQKRQLVTNDLVQIDGEYQMDLTDFEEKIKENQVKLFILCSPHNPVGRVWTKEELTAVLKICQKYQVLVIADEIHSDLILPGYQFVSAAKLSNETAFENLIICNAPSKTFNLATLLNSHVWIVSQKNRAGYEAWVKEHKQTENSSLGQLAAKTAYETGDQWLENFLGVIELNYQLVKEHLQKTAPKIKVGQLQGTYLLWLDLRDVVSDEAVKTFIQDEAKLAVDFGEWFSPKTKGFVRINLATSPENIKEAVTRISKTYKKWEGSKI